jgi:hypothetical protein
MRDVSIAQITAYIGNNIRDEYGRVRGRLAGPLITPLGRLDAILVEHEDGEFTKHSTDQLKFEDGELKIISIPKIDSESLSTEVSFAWRRIQALEGLLKREIITQETYNELHNQYVSTLDQLKDRVTKTLEELNSRIADCDLQSKYLQEALTDIEVALATGEFKEEEYSKGLEILRKGFNSIVLEKTELESLVREIKIYLTAPPQKLQDYTLNEDSDKPLTVRITNDDTAAELARDQGIKF